MYQKDIRTKIGKYIKSIICLSNLTFQQESVKSEDRNMATLCMCENVL